MFIVEKLYSVDDMLYLPHIRALRGRQLSSHAVSIPHNAII
jgi:hypothetical protein